MQAVLICPGERPAVGFLAQSLPLVAIPVLGESLIGRWMEDLAEARFRNVIVLATDRPELVRSVVKDGSRWGLKVEVKAELQEWSPAEATAKYPNHTPAFPECKVALLDHLPGRPQLPMFRSYSDWFQAVLACMPSTDATNRIGLHQVKPQVWCGLRTHLSPTAQLHAPCWIGDYVSVGANTVIGPDAVLENGVVIDSAAEVRSSLVGPDTFVGTLTRVEDSIAWGNTLIDWRSGSCTQVPDAFLLSALGQRHLPETTRSASSLVSGLRTVLSRPLDLVAEVHARLWPR